MNGLFQNALCEASIEKDFLCRNLEGGSQLKNIKIPEPKSTCQNTREDRLENATILAGGWSLVFAFITVVFITFAFITVVFITFAFITVVFITFVFITVVFYYSIAS